MKADSPEYRRDPVSNRWIILAPERSLRPLGLSGSKPHARRDAERDSCPFCEGQEKHTTGEVYVIRETDSQVDKPGWTLRVVPNKFPALVVWGGATDFFILNFDRASRRYRDALRQDQHAVVQCVHSAGHGIPPFAQPSDGGTKFAPFWEFFRDHPFGLPPNTTPYRQTGLPPSFPSLCSLSP